MADGLLLEETGPVLTLTFDRPEVGNAFNMDMLYTFQRTLNEIDFEKTRALVLKASGKHFCTGADLKWMQSGIAKAPEQNLKELVDLAKLLQTLFELPIPTIAVVQGNAYAGAIGFIAACDFAIGNETAQFCISEARIGLIPGIISPYLQHAMGARAAARLSLLATPFSAQQAYEAGLLSEVVTSEKLTEALNALITQLLKNGPNALGMIKTLFNKKIDLHSIQHTTTLLARIRSEHEAQEGMRAFFEKRLPTWYREHKPA